MTSISDGESAASVRTKLNAVLGLNAALSVFRPEDYGAVGDGDLTAGTGTDDSDAFISMLAAIYSAGGGRVALGRKVYRLTKALILSNTSTSSTFGKQPPIKFTGAGHDTSGQGGMPVGGSILMWTAETGTGAVGKIDTRGLGTLVMEDITLASRGCSLPFIHTTFTTVKLDRVSAWTSRAATAATEDFIVFGGTIAHESVPGTDLTGGDVGFQGYGSVVDSCHMMGGIRRLAYLRTYANGIIIRDNCVWNTNGNPLSGGAAIELDGADSYATANVITGNLLELTHYVYGIKTTKVVQNCIAFNTGFDGAVTSLAMVRLEANSLQNVIISSIGPTARGGTYLSDNSGSTSNVHISAQGTGQASTFAGLLVQEGATVNHLLISGVPTSSRLLIQPSAAKALTAKYAEIKTSVADGDVSAFSVLGNGTINVDGTGAGNITNGRSSGASWSSNGRKLLANGTGGNIEINSGSGGSYLDLKNYGVRNYDHAGSLQAKFTSSAAGSGNIGWDFGTAGSISFYALSTTGMLTNKKLLATLGIGVGNSAAATTLGTVTKKMEVFDAAGASLGFVPIYDAIT